MPNPNRRRFVSLLVRLAIPFLLFNFGGLFRKVSAQNRQTRPAARLITSGASYGEHPTTSNSANTSPTLIEANAIERRAFEQTNAVRVQHGLLPFVWDADLCRMARRHSENMARFGFFSHVTPDGQRLRDRARAAGIEHFSLLGENIAYNLGYDDPGAFAVERWMISPGHRENILQPGFRAMAIGTFVASDGSVFLTQVFITR